MPSIHKHHDGAALFGVAAFVICMLGGTYLWEPFAAVALLIPAAFVFFRRK